MKQEKNTYPRKELSFHQLGAENFSPEVPTIYAIEWDGVTYELLIHRQPKSGQAVVWGNGAVDKTKHSLPIFQRHSWGNSQAFNGIWYFDPTLYRGESSLYWCYGTNDRWYLKDIAYLVYFILNTWNISMKQVLYFGSSGGGFTSMMLAVLLRGKALAINPQFDCRRYYNSTYLNLLKEHVLDTSEELITARISVVECIRKEKYFPSIHVVENLLSKRDMKDQLIFFLEEISSCDEEGPLRITFYRNTNGHNGLPSKEQCIELIKQDMPTPELPPEWIRRIAKKS